MCVRVLACARVQMPGRWQEELRFLPPSVLGRLLMSSPPVLMRLDFYASVARFNGSAGKPVPSMARIVVMRKDAWNLQ